MQTVTPDLLARYLDDPETRQQLTLEASAETAVELRDLLEVAQGITAPPPVTLSSGAHARGRAALLAAITEEQTRRSPLANALDRVDKIVQLVLSWVQGLRRVAPERRSYATLAALPVIAVTLAFVSLSFVGTDAVRAATNALPGDTLYPVRVTFEHISVAIATSDADRAKDLVGLADDQVAEIQQASKADRPAAASTAAVRYSQDVSQAASYVSRIEAQHPEPTLARTVSQEITQQQRALAVEVAQAPPAVQPAVATASAAAERSLTLAQAHTSDGASTTSGSAATAGRALRSMGNALPPPAAPAVPTASPPIPAAPPAAPIAAAPITSPISSATAGSGSADSSSGTSKTPPVAASTPVPVAASYGGAGTGDNRGNSGAGGRSGSSFPPVRPPGGRRDRGSGNQQNGGSDNRPGSGSGNPPGALGGPVSPPSGQPGTAPGTSQDQNSGSSSPDRKIHRVPVSQDQNTAVRGRVSIAKNAPSH
jgi:hypothetical protein